MKEFYSQSGMCLSKMPDEIKLPKQKLERNYESSVVYEAYKNIVEKNSQRLNQNAKNINKIAITETYTVGDKVKTMFRELLHHKKFVFNNLFPIQKCSRPEIVTAFTGLLELSRRSKVLTNQEELFGNIEVEKRRIQR